MKIDSEVLRTAFSNIDYVPPGALESSLCVRMRTNNQGCNLTLTGVLHAESDIPAENLDDRTIYVDRKLLRNVLNNAEKVITVKVGNESVVFQSGKCRVEAPQRQVSGGYGARPKGDGVSTTLLDRTLAHLKMLSQFTPKPPTDPHLAAILLTKDAAYASDGFNMVAVQEKTGLKSTFRFPVELAAVANQLGVATITTVNGTSRLDTPTGVVCRTLNADLERYPEKAICGNIEIAAKQKPLLRISGKDFCEALHMLHGFGAGEAKVRMTVASGEMRCLLQLQGPTKVEYTLKVNEAAGNITTSFYLTPLRVWADYVNADTSGEGEFEFSRLSEYGTLCVQAESGISRHFILSVEDQDGQSVETTSEPEEEETKPIKATKASKASKRTK